MARTINGTDIWSSASVTHGIGTGDFACHAWVNVGVFSADSAVFSFNGINPVCYFNNTGVPKIYLGADITFNTTFSTSTWYSVGWQRTGTLLECFVNGVVEATTANRSDSVGNGVIIVGADSGGGGDAFDGQIAEPAIWSGAIGASGFASLAKGFSPSLIPCPAGARLGYWNFIGRGGAGGTEVERWGGRVGNLTTGGTGAPTAHPRIFKPSRAQVRRFGSGGGSPPPSATIPYMLTLLGAA